MSQQICLKWNKHPSIINDFQNFLLTEAMVDVTLTCDGKRLKAHKLILSAGSALFQSLLLENPCHHPVIILQGVGYTELKTVIDFMYNGEVNITEDKLAAVIKCAETLRVKVLGDVMIETDESGKAPANQSGDGFEFQSSAASANLSNDQSKDLPENRQSHQSADRTDTTSYKQGSAEIRKSADGTSGAEHIMADPSIEELSGDMESSASDASTSTVPSLLDSMNSFSQSQEKCVPIKESVEALIIPHLSHSMDSLQEEQPIEESMPEAFVVIEDFENIPISVVERLLTDDPKKQQNSPDRLKKQNPRSRSRSKKQHQSSPDRVKKQNSRSRSHSKKQYQGSPDSLKKQKPRSRSHSKKRYQDQGSPDHLKKQISRSRSRSRKRYQGSPDSLKKQKPRSRSHTKKRHHSSSASLKEQNQKSLSCSKEQYESSPVHPKKKNEKSPGRSKECNQNNLDPLNKQNKKSPDCSKEQHQSSLDYSEDQYYSITGDSNEKQHYNSSQNASSKKQHQSNSVGHSKELYQSNNLDYSKEQYQSSSYSSNKRQQLSENHSKKAKYHNSSNYSKERHQSSSIFLVTHCQTSSDCSKEGYQCSSEHSDKEDHLSDPKHSDQEQYLSNRDYSDVELLESNSDLSDNEQPQDSLDHSDKEQYPRSSYRSSSLPPLKPTPNLPIVLCELMSMSDYQYSTALPASPSSELEEDEDVQEIKKQSYIKNDSAARKILDKIENTPSGARFYTCRKCSFKTLYPLSLKKHVISKHEKKKCFKCDECSYAATLKQSLKRHKAEVHENVQFQCSLCLYTCTQKSHLKRHMDCIHEGKKLFMC